MSHRWILLFAISLMCRTENATAANQVTVLEVTQSVLARLPPADWSELHRGDVLKEGYEISSDPDGEVKLGFQDNSVVVIRPTSQVKIASFFTRGNLVRTQILLKVGDIAAQVNRKQGVSSDFRVQTATATASVRGTKINSVSFDAIWGLRVSLENGSLLITGRDGDIHLAGRERGEISYRTGELNDPLHLLRNLLGAPGIPQGFTESEIEFLKLYGGPVSLHAGSDSSLPTNVNSGIVRSSGPFDPGGIIAAFNVQFFNNPLSSFHHAAAAIVAADEVLIQRAQQLNYPQAFIAGFTQIVSVIEQVEHEFSPGARSPHTGTVTPPGDTSSPGGTGGTGGTGSPGGPDGRPILTPTQASTLKAAFNLVFQGEFQAGITLTTLAQFRTIVAYDLMALQAPTPSGYSAKPSARTFAALPSNHVPHHHYSTNIPQPLPHH